MEKDKTTPEQAIHDLILALPYLTRFTEGRGPTQLPGRKRIQSLEILRLKRPGPTE